MRRMADPQNVQALAQMQQSMQQLQQAGVFPPGMMPGMPGAGGAGGAVAGDPMAGLNAFSNLHLGGSGGERTHCCTDPGLGWVGLRWADVLLRGFRRWRCWVCARSSEAALLRVGVVALCSAAALLFLFDGELRGRGVVSSA